ncbi:ATP-dependent protease Lon [Suttonella ornithocola]|uniref:ATP-dependent protease Lon n=2 Tax=Suttonella ornithocola TaxID=279832 RepID=A0A380MYB2_9GAMM|nr:ATP-dependent protease Lon [Suttonella ornithocola]
MITDKLTTAISAVKNAIQTAVIGQQTAIEQVLVALLAGGHVLIEGSPGLGKTLLVQSLAKVFSTSFKRIQFTPDLLPADITGSLIFDAKAGEFRLHKGPIFTHLLLADEINRAPAKTQSALLEVMQEKQVTIEGQTLAVPQPFMVLATQNPFEQEGTYRLPEAQLDRFLLSITIPYPEHNEERQLLSEMLSQTNPTMSRSESICSLFSPQQLAALQQSVTHIRTDERIIDYALSIVRQTRQFEGLASGAGPRAGMALLLCARAYALIQGRAYVLPEDIKTLALPVLRHRVIRSAEAEIENLATDDILTQLLSTIPAPRE